MTLASAIIQKAYREGNIIPAGKNPTTDEQTEALDLLNSYINGVFGFEVGEGLADWQVPSFQRTAPVAANYPQFPYPQTIDETLYPSPLANDATQQVWEVPPKNSRLIFGGSNNLTVYFPEAPDDGSRMALIAGGSLVDGTTITLDGNGRLIEGEVTQEATAPITAAQWLYRADLGDWRAITDVALADDIPFPKDLDDLFITAIAIRLAPRYGKEIAIGTSATFKTMMAHLKARYRQAGTTIFGAQDIPNSRQSYRTPGSWMG